MQSMTKLNEAEAVALFGNRFLTEMAPSTTFPESGMRPLDALRLVGEELNMEGDPQRNLATFVTTWMEPEAQRIIAENLHRNFIDHAEYPISAEIEQRCVRMLADLFNAPGETTGCRTQGSSEAIMRMQRCSISAVCGYSAWSMKLRCRFSAITRWASGSIQVVTNVARLRIGMPSSTSSSPISRIASTDRMPCCGSWLSGAGSSRNRFP